MNTLNFYQTIGLVSCLLFARAASAQVEAVKSDFIPGDILIFFDGLTKEKIGEFPSKWDLLKGSKNLGIYSNPK